MIQQKINNLRTDLEALGDDWEAKYAYIIDMGKRLPAIDVAYKTDEYKIAGCQSNAWLHTEVKDDKVVFSADADAIIAKGILATILNIFNDATPEEIIDADTQFIHDIGLTKILSPVRAVGLEYMIVRMKHDVESLTLTSSPGRELEDVT